MNCCTALCFPLDYCECGTCVYGFQSTSTQHSDGRDWTFVSQYELDARGFQLEEGHRVYTRSAGNCECCWLSCCLGISAAGGAFCCLPCFTCNQHSFCCLKYGEVADHASGLGRKVRIVVETQQLLVSS